MLKKSLVLAGMFIVISACVITSPAEIFVSTPTICVECVQATLCAENPTGDCGIDVPPLPGEQPSVDLTKTAADDSGLMDATAAAFFTQSAIYALTDEPDMVDPTAAAFLTQATFYFTPLAPTATLTPVPSKTPFPPTSTPEPPTATPTITRTPRDWLYRVQPGSPKHTKNFGHPEDGCDWGGIAGQIFGPGGVPQTNIVVVVSGEAKGTPVNLMGYAGTAPQYGPNGYEVKFPQGPIRTEDDLFAQLFDLKGNELSDMVPFDTYSDCARNLVVLNFVLASDE
ncbi:MAG: hypothetical protein GX577_07115 [Leptolinea sp.]|nr:hypothetical protein [Leptolinea sp.]